MVIFRDEKYLQNAVLQKRNIQSRCLLTVPSHLTDLYPHKGQVDDTAYRFLWKKIQLDQGFLQSQALIQDSDVPKLTDVSLPVSYYEPFDDAQSKDSSFSESINFNLHCDVIPTSNPGSPDLFDIGDENCKNSNIIDDSYCKEDLQLFSVANDNLKLETLLKSSEKPEKLRRQVPGLSKLMVRLKSMGTTDPLTDKNGCVFSEKKIFRESLLLSSEPQEIETKPLDIHIIDDAFEKDSTYSHPKENELESVITPSLDLPKKKDVYHTLLTKLGCSLHFLQQILMDKDKTINEEIDIKIVKDIKDTSAHMQPFTTYLPEDEEVTFLDVNEPVLTDIDNICEDALLDAPVTISQEQHIGIDFPECRPLDICLTSPKFLDAKKRKCLEKMCFSSEFYCNEIQAFRLAEPYNLEFETELIVPEIPIEQVKTVCYLERQITASLELELPWDIAKISDLRKDPTHTFEKLDMEKGEISFSSSNEIFTTAGLEDFCDLNLPEEYDTEDCLENIEETTGTGTDQLKIPSQTEAAAIYQGESNNAESSSQIKKADQLNSETSVVKQMPEKGLEQIQEKIIDGQMSMMAGIGSDPLGDFMALRSRRNVSVLKSCKQIVETAALREKSDKQVPDEFREDVCPSSKQSVARSKKIKHHVIVVRLSESYQKLASMLEDSALNYLTLLQTSNEITRSSSFKTLSSDVTRFLIKRREKFLQDNNIKATADDTYRHILCLHGLTWAAEILVNGCLESALGFLSAITERYKVFIQNMLKTVHQKLFQSSEKFGQQHILHPKMTELSKEIEVWLKKKRAKSRDNEQKVLIIVRKNLPHLKNTLKKVLSLSKLLQPEVVDTNDSDSLIDSLDAHNCLIIHTDLVQDTFPWAQFSLVVEYEHQEKLEWRDHCERQNIRHMSVKVQQDVEQDQCDWEVKKSESYERQIALIVSHKVTTNSTLLQIFESRFNIQLYERDYSLLDGNKSLHFSDFDIDESTSVILEDISNLREDRSVQNVVTRIIALSLKYVTCFCIFYTMEKSGFTGYQYPSHVVANLCKLQAACLSFESKSKTNYRTKIMICSGVYDLAAVIRRISEDTMKSQTHKSDEEWLDRSWLKLDASQEEKFLIQSPCISSFSAQIMLKEIGLTKILRSSEDDLAIAFPGMSRVTLKMFHESLHIQNSNWAFQKTSHTEKKRHTITSEIKRENKLTSLSTSNLRISKLDFDGSTTNDSLNFQDKRTIEKSQLAFPSDSNVIVENHRGITDISDTEGHTKTFSNQDVFTYQPSAVLNGKRASIHGFVGKIVPVSVDSSKRCTLEPNNELGYNANRNSSLGPVTQLTSISGVDLQKLKDQQSLDKTQDCQRTFDLLNRNSHLKKTYERKQLELSNRNVTSAEQSFRKFYKSKQHATQEIHHKQIRPADIPGNVNTTFTNNEQLPAEGRNIVAQDVYQPVSGHPIQTFEYNHGLPKSATNSMQQCDTNAVNVIDDEVPHFYERLAVDVIENEALMKRRDLKRQFSALIIQEFPPSHEINKTLPSGYKSVEKDDHSPRQFKISLSDHTSSHFKNNIHQTYLPEKENEMEAFSEQSSAYNPSSTLFIKPLYSNMCSRENRNDSYLDRRSFSETSELWPKTENSHIIGDQKAVSQPQLSKLMSKGLDQSQSSTFASTGSETHVIENGNMVRPSSYETCLNPNMHRISLRPNCLQQVQQGSEVDSYMNKNSFEENLREATRRFLQNSEKLPRFSHNTSRYPLEKKSIGLAQPLQREKVVNEMRPGRSVSAWTNEEKRKMAQSLWATEDSPPMDLDYEDSQVNMCLNANKNFAEKTKKEVFYGQTPQKKRKLTYQKIPGKKGQTKLIFK